jgi:dTDP-glucose pyrophosphorylase
MRDRLDRCRVAETGRLLDALRVLETGGMEVALIVDAEERLIGILTDGDIRRALLAGVSLDAPLASHANRSFTKVSNRAGRAEVLDLMRARTIGQIPIVDDAGKLRGLHQLHEIIGGASRPNWAVIMAGGRGARLRPITDEIPKPMIRVAGRPILERIVLHLVGFGIKRIFLSVNHLGEQIEQHFGDGHTHGCRIEYLREKEPLGTGGSLALLPDRPRDPLLVMNGDLITEADVGAMLDFHRDGGQTATLAVRRYQHVVPFGCVDVDGDRILRMEEKPSLVRIVNAGMYVLDPAVVARVPRAPIGLPTIVEQCVEAGETARIFEVETDWIDVGRPDQLKQARGGTP